MENKQKIVFPIHINQSLLFLKGIQKQIDLVVHVVDSRSITASGFLNAEKIFPGKKILKIYSKKDMTDGFIKENTFDFKNIKNRRKIIKLIKNSVDEINNKNYKICAQIVIVGIPNVGKSTLIKLLKNTSNVKSENSPGTTKQITKFYLGDSLWLYDSPGILLPNLNNQENIIKLFLLNALPISNLDISFFLEKTYLYLKENYLNKIFEICGEETENYYDFLEKLTKKYNIKDKNYDSQIAKGESKFLWIIHSGKIGKIYWDKPWNF